MLNKTIKLIILFSPEFLFYMKINSVLYMWKYKFREVLLPNITLVYKVDLYIHKHSTKSSFA